MGLSIKMCSTQFYHEKLMSQFILNKTWIFESFSFIFFVIFFLLPAGHNSFTATVTEGKELNCLLVNGVHVDSLFNCELIIGESRFVQLRRRRHAASTLDKTLGPVSARHSFYVFLLFQFASGMAALGSAGRSCGERESWGDF